MGVLKKFRPDDTIEKYRARLMANGYNRKKVKIILILIHLLPV
jgi:hypothetical protein